MDFPRLLVDQLARLTEALDSPGTDLEAVLAVLTDDLQAAIPSFLGLDMVMHIGGNGVSLVGIEPADLERAGASMLLPLYLISGTDPASTMILYAANPGAFVDLAADTRAAFGLDGEIVLDGHLHPPVQDTAILGLAEFSVVNEAIGVLIVQGFTAEEARVELERRAHEDGVTLLMSAQRQIDDMGTSPTE